METLFISDLHLNRNRPYITRKFINFLKTTATRSDALYILGDLFDVWIGDDDHQRLHRLIIDALNQLSTNHQVPIYLMPGNRDFLIGHAFCHASHCQLLPDPLTINLYGTKTLITHGDLLCTQDIEYLKFRQKVRR